jgi:hypothetical protein
MNLTAFKSKQLCTVTNIYSLHVSWINWSRRFERNKCIQITKQCFIKKYKSKIRDSYWKKKFTFVFSFLEEKKIQIEKYKIKMKLLMLLTLTMSMKALQSESILESSKAIFVNGELDPWSSISVNSDQPPDGCFAYLIPGMLFYFFLLFFFNLQIFYCLFWFHHEKGASHCSDMILPTIRALRLHTWASRLKSIQHLMKCCRVLVEKKRISESWRIKNQNFVQKENIAILFFAQF